MSKRLPAVFRNQLPHVQLSWTRTDPSGALGYLWGRNIHPIAPIVPVSKNQILAVSTTPYRSGIVWGMPPAGVVPDARVVPMESDLFALLLQSLRVLHGTVGVIALLENYEATVFRVAEKQGGIYDTWPEIIEAIGIVCNNENLTDAQMDAADRAIAFAELLCYVQGKNPDELFSKGR